MLAGIRYMLIISSPEYFNNYRRLFDDDTPLGRGISYAERPSPDGLAQAFTIGADFIGDGYIVLVVGDNIFFAHLTDLLASAVARPDGATVFSYRVDDSERYGVSEFGEGWQMDSNTVRLHSSLGGLAPADFYELPPARGI